MGPHPGAIATAVLLVLSSGCLAFEPITQTPPPTDSAPYIIETFPSAPQVKLKFVSGNTCQILVSVTAIAPQAQQLYAQFYLNFQSALTEQAQLTYGTESTITMDQGSDPGLYQLTNVALDPLTIPSSLLPASPTGASNLITVFVSDGFPPEGPLQPESGSSYYTTSWTWQMIIDDPVCLQLFSNITQ